MNNSCWIIINKTEWGVVLTPLQHCFEEIQNLSNLIIFYLNVHIFTSKGDLTFGGYRTQSLAITVILIKDSISDDILFEKAIVLYTMKPAMPTLVTVVSGADFSLCGQKCVFPPGRQPLPVSFFLRHNLRFLRSEQTLKAPRKHRYIRALNYETHGSPGLNSLFSLPPCTNMPSNSQATTLHFPTLT